MLERMKCSEEISSGALLILWKCEDLAVWTSASMKEDRNPSSSSRKGARIWPGGR